MLCALASLRSTISRPQFSGTLHIPIQLPLHEEEALGDESKRALSRARGVSGQGKTKGLAGTKYTGKLPLLPLIQNQLAVQLPLARIQSGTYPTVFIRGGKLPLARIQGGTYPPVFAYP